MFRIQDNVPQIYINESRDFQLISRLYDVLYSSSKYDIDSMVNILDATLVRDNLLQLMCTRIGFFPTTNIDANVLKYIIASFPYIVRNKGTQVGVEYAINAILKAESNPQSVGKPHIVVQNAISDDLSEQDSYCITIYTTIDIYNKKALDEIMRYVLPIGVQYRILPYFTVGEVAPTIVLQDDKVNIAKVITNRQGYIRNSLVVDTIQNGDGKVVDRNPFVLWQSIDDGQVVSSSSYNNGNIPSNNTSIKTQMKDNKLDSDVEKLIVIQKDINTLDINIKN